MTSSARPSARALLLAGLCLTVPALQAADAPAAAKPAAAAAKPAAPAPKPATSREQLKSQAKGLALATETVEQINEAQLEAASRVMLGDSDCEFNQKVTISAIDGVPGHFHVGFKKMRYRVVAQETTTGAVRLEDKKAGIVWLQIPTKSMLMNSRIGQRLVDACMHADQRAAVTAVEAAAKAMKVAEAASAAAATATAASTPAAPAAAPVAVPVAASAPATAASN